MMRWTIALFAFTLVALQLELWFADSRRPGLNAVQEAVAEQTRTNRALIERNADLRAEIISLQQDNEAAEERARSELGMVRPEETFFQVAEPTTSVDIE
jgi:cell division protein FtsB